MRAVITVIGKDQVGIIANVSNILAQYSINILDISQTVMTDIFTMIMMVEISKSKVGIADIADLLAKKGEEIGLSIRIQHEDIFNSMHRI
ncbi:MAG: ACT domain-containing protein [Hyphomonadaceae bacterium]|nr:ACT domain-containing protein [Clostridia bacterium]